ncbi:MAG TPA: FtsX-like permease family protein [Acidimicrobiia bacterium]|nr:FtsX-like permease family protein [Acidimicrobiia bacterium]
MSAVRMLAGNDIRRRWRSVVALTLLVGAVGAIVLATAAGARRSHSALPRFNAYSRSSDVEISIGIPTASQLAAFRRSPGVAAMAYLHAYSLQIKGHENLAIAAPADSAMGTVVDRVRLVKGRLADPTAPDEVTIGERLAAQTHLGVGSHLEAESFSQAQIDKAFSGGDPGPPAGPRLRLRVVGIVRRPLDLGVREESGGVALLTPGFGKKYEGRIGRFTDVLRVKTDAGTADVPRVIATARKLWGKAQTFSVQPLGIETQGANSAIDVLTAALWIFAGVTALAGAVAIGIVLTRDIARASVDQLTLRSLGVTHGQRGVASSARALIIAGGSALLAGTGAVLASPLFPLRLARRADPDVGLHADWVVLGIGVVLVAVVVLSVAFVAAWRATRVLSPDRSRLPSRPFTAPVVEAAARAGMPPAATNGLRMALQAGRGESAVPIRSAFAGAVAGIAGITAVFVFAASLGHLESTPKLYGWTFDLKTEVGTKPGVPCADRDDHGLADAPGVAAIAIACTQGVEVDGHPVSAWAIQSLRGAISPAIVAGRAPRGASEIALGSVTLDATKKRIGDTVRVEAQGGDRRYRIVGRTVLPTLSSESLQPLADGASFTIAGLRPILVSGANETHFLLVKARSGADIDALERRARAIPRSKNTGTPSIPVEIDRLRQINWFPAILAILLTSLALVAVGHALVTSVRRRRREIALLKTIGFGRRQVGATIAWQATTLAFVGLAVGVPIGLVIGRSVWQLVADGFWWSASGGGLGVETVTAVPTLGLIVTIVGAIALVNVIAFFPGRSAARTRPAVALRSE